MPKNLYPANRRCIDCQSPISRRAKFRCRNCHTEFMKRKMGNKNPSWKENPSNVAYNKIILNRFGNATTCSNVNCQRKSFSYKMVRLKTSVGRTRGIWIELCKPCLRNLASLYQHKKKGGD